MSKPKSICLNMIVKNEAKIIKKTLSNLCAYVNFNYWVICDTGSEDETVPIILDFFKEKKIPGEIFHHKWKDFGNNRTLALSMAYNKSDFLLIFDADDSINGDFKMPDLLYDSYNAFFGSANFKYVRPIIINNRKKWKYRGILHEYLISLENTTRAKTIEGDYFIKSGREGNRSSNPNKYSDDALLLKNQIDYLLNSNDPDVDLIPRYTFYCANSFKDSGDIYNAIIYYKKVLDCETWVQEKFLSALYIGDMYEKLNNMDDAIIYWQKAISYDKERRENIVKIMDHYLKLENFFVVNCIYEKIKGFKINDVSTKLFLDLSRYDDIHFLNSIAACYVAEWMSGYYSCKYLILNDKHIDLALYNFKCYCYNIHLDPENKIFLDKLLILFKKFYPFKKELIEHLWSIMSGHMRAIYNFESIYDFLLKDNALSLRDHKDHNL